ncbi:MAG: phosphomannose isomerase type II C-terminal cupin domain [Candidatus Omnitrophota bacterium]
MLKKSKRKIPRFNKKHSVRPWGEYRMLFYEPKVWVKRVKVKSKCRLSLQKHQHRSEKWIIVEGRGLAVVNKKKLAVVPGTVVDVPLGAVHRIGNTGKKDLVFIEVACGKYLGEDDIIRIQDDFNRIIK